MEYTLTITCPLCGGVGYRESTAPFIYLDAAGIHTHATHHPGCTATQETGYQVTREPMVYRHLPDDPESPEEK